MMHDSAIFVQVFGEDATQEAVYDATARDIVDAVIAGYNGMAPTCPSWLISEIECMLQDASLITHQQQCFAE